MKLFNAHIFYDGSIHSKGNADYIANILYNIKQGEYRIVADILDINYDVTMAKSYGIENGPDIVVTILDENNNELYRVEGQTPDAIVSLIHRNMENRKLL